VEVVRELIESGDYCVSLDLKNGYFHVPIAAQYHKYLGFSIANQAYVFTALPFGLASAPRIFTKLFKPLIAFLRFKGMRIVIYIDDILIMARSVQECRLQLKQVLRLLTYLGFVINLSKSTTEPSQAIEYLGYIWDTASMKICLNEKRRVKATTLISELLEATNPVSLRSLSAVLGTLVSMRPCFPNAPLYYRSTQRHMIKQLHASHENYEATTTLSSPVRSELTTFLRLLTVCPLAPIRHGLPTMVLSTDASPNGWGAVCGPHRARGSWSRREQQQHINYLELRAVCHAVKRWSTVLQDQTVFFLIDNTTAIAYLKHRGGTASKRLCRQALKIWDLLIRYRITPLFKYVCSEENLEADALSRNSASSLVWVLSPAVASRLFKCTGLPEVDLFATRHNAQCARFVSPHADSQAFGIDGLSFPWKGFRLLYAFPPVSLILLVLRRLELYPNVTLILIVPLWRSQPWYPVLLRSLVEMPLLLPFGDLILSDTLSGPTLKLRKEWQFLACRVAGSALAQRRFHQVCRNFWNDDTPLPRVLDTLQYGTPGCLGQVDDRLIPYRPL
jgi:hypothetical protein